MELRRAIDDAFCFCPGETDGSTAVKQRQSWSKHLAQTSANTFRLRPRGYDVRAYRRHCRALLMCSNAPSVKLAVHEQREVDLTGQQCRTGLLQQ
jgi:hypothetical protein